MVEIIDFMDFLFIGNEMEIGTLGDFVTDWLATLTHHEFEVFLLEEDFVLDHLVLLVVLIGVGNGANEVFVLQH